MSSLLRKNHPYSLLNDVNSLFSLWDDAQDTSKGAMSHWHPSVDIKETPSAFVIEADIPGVSPEKIDIAMEKNVLTIQGARSETSEEKTDSYARTERVKGKFFRQFTLPESADCANIQARSKHGVLELSIPKMEKAQPRRVEIKVDVS